MKSRHSLTLVIILSLAVLASSAICPAGCSCTTNTIQCLKCLQVYFRDYSTDLKTCVCMDGFQQLIPQSYFCCPRNCSICSDYLGCAACPRKWMMQPNMLLLVVVCACQPNYFFDGADCQCSSQTHPAQFYEDIQNSVCFNCPQGCVCNTTGCAACTAETRRVVTTDRLGKKLCGCAPPYVIVGGSCVCPKLCTCDASTGSMACQSESRRQLTLSGAWQCQSPYVDTNLECICASPYVAVNSSMLVAYDPSQQCMCGSILRPANYYLNREQQCQACQYGCSCSEVGCYYCNPAYNRVAQNGTCNCISPRVSLYGLCVCVWPYFAYYTGCYCQSQISPTEYVVDEPEYICYACPAGCTCDATGCFSCTTQSLRLVQPIASKFSCRSCQPYAVLMDGICVCGSNSVYNNGNCSCISATAVYQDFTQGSTCKPCPPLCSCNETGCYSCQAAAFRDIIPTPSGLFVCKCKLGSTPNNVGACICGGFFNSSTGLCDCTLPYYLTPQGTCSCLSDNDPIAYYFDYDAKQCYSCPYGCQCNSTGCFNCDPNSLRTSYIKDGHTFCPCIQTAVLTNGACRMCPYQFYYLSGGCVACPKCLTCDLRGCTSCLSGMKLDGFDCVCEVSFLVNDDGRCRCPLAHYYDNVTVSCLACSAKCLDCLSGNSCLACPTGMNRLDIPTLSCPCMDNYRQLGLIQPYCCHDTCLTCNQTGCLSCLIYTNRQYNSTTQKCDCINNLKQINSGITCGCLSTQYLFSDGWCYPCPKNCLTCLFIRATQSFICTSCRANSNRNLSSRTCSCLSNFYQWTPVLEFCYPNHCASAEVKCTKCDNSTNRVPSADGLTCECARGTYQDQYGRCGDCQMEGCLACATVSYCLECNRTAGYYLVSKLCQKVVPNTSLIFSQSRFGIFLQLNTSANTSQYPELMSVDASMVTVYNSTTSSEILDDPVVLSLKSSSVGPGGILTVLLENPTNQSNNTMITIHFVLAKRASRLLSTWNGSDARGPYEAYEDSKYVYKTHIIEFQKLNYSSYWYATAQNAIVGVLWLLSLCLYVVGYKHNQTIFFIQTLTFISFAIVDNPSELCIALFGLNYSYYNIGNVLSWLIPKDYMESSPGNFPILTFDSNLLRVAGTTLVVAIANTLAIGLLRVLYYLFKAIPCCRAVRCLRVLDKFRKYIYRFLEFIYKTTMYPLVFFSFVTFDNEANGLNVLISNAVYSELCLIACVAIPLGYLLVSIWQATCQTTSKIYKFENLMEFVSVVLSAMIVALSMHNLAYIATFVVFLLRALGYLYLRIRYLRDFQRFEYLKGISTLFEMITIWLIPSQSPIAVLACMLVAVCSQTIHSVKVILNTDQLAKTDKRYTPFTLPEEQLSDIQLPKETDHQENLKSQVSSAH